MTVNDYQKNQNEVDEVSSECSDAAISHFGTTGRNNAYQYDTQLNYQQQDLRNYGYYQNDYYETSTYDYNTYSTPSQSYPQQPFNGSTIDYSTEMYPYNSSVVGQQQMYSQPVAGSNYLPTNPSALGNNYKPSTVGTNYLKKDEKNLNRMSAISGKSFQTERYCCGMFGSQRRCFLVCIPIGICILVGLAAAIFFLFPRVPGFTVSEPLNTELRQFGSIDDVRTANPSKPFIAEFSLRVDAFVYSENYIPWTLNQLNIEGRLVDPRSSNPNDSPKIGSGSKKNVILEARKNNTVAFLFNVNYKRDQPLTIDNRSEDRILFLIASYCKPEAFGLPLLPNTRPGFIQLKVQTAVNFLGINMGAPDMVSRFPCPQSALDLLDLIVTATTLPQT